ncbi:MAG: acyl-CoA dehydrogenase family protein [Burkholderiaceae bacterium]|nr:acyl-CoA dehydrogenase family protein [Burkholderiaceae bacterium]MDO9089956.1 acyl-CoA dehydrogenase family protein [Burkholderiaceae bacterium]
MNLNIGAGYEAFRDEVRRFLAANWQAGTRANPQEIRAFRGKAIAAGLLYRHIPVAYGGAGGGYDSIKAMLVQQEFERVGAPGEITGIGPRMLAPTLVARGQAWQKERFIAPTLLGDYVWCQGYSEPGSGSDLASLSTRAVLDGDHWLINGQKIWTSHAHYAHYMFVLVRTEPDAPRHQGISYLLLDMKTPGITVRPLRQMQGASGFNEVFFDNVRTPADWIVGQRGEGWSVARTTLSFERASINAPEMMSALFDKLKALAASTVRDGSPLLAQAHFQQAFAALEAHVLSHRFSVTRQRSMDAVGQSPGLATLCNKLYGTDIGLRIAELAQEVIGDGGLMMPGEGVTSDNLDWPFWIMRSLGVTIAGGTSNVQRNIIAERGLGLPRQAGGTA